jgi:hypothetical protein
VSWWICPPELFYPLAHVRAEEQPTDARLVDES